MTEHLIENDPENKDKYKSNLKKLKDLETKKSKNLPLFSMNLPVLRKKI